MEQESVNQRIKNLVDHYTKGNKSAFAKLAGISNQSLSEILGGRQSAPSFAALQKIALAFPQVRMEWLILGQEPMLQEHPEGAAAQPVPTPAQMQEIVASVYTSVAESPEMKQRIADISANARANAYAEQEMIMRVYRVSINHPEYRKLSERLGVTEQEARDLVVNGRIAACYIGPDTDRGRRNGASYLIPEDAVREFLNKKA